jgi:hypothetical protein
MPILRLHNDPTLTNAFGPMIDAIGNSWDPKTRAEAYALQQRIFLERFQLMQEQQKNDAANRAVQYYSSVVPADKLPVIESLVRQGAGYDQVARAAADLGTNYIDSTDAAAKAFNLQRYQRLNGGKMPDSPLTLVVGANTQAQRQAEEAQQKQAEARGTARGTLQGAGIDVNKQLLFPEGDNPLAPVTASATAPGGQQSTGAASGQPAPKTQISNPAAPYEVPTTIVQQTASGVLTGASDVEGTKAINTQRKSDLDQAVNEGRAATKLKVVLGQIQQLATYLNASGLSGQADAAWRNWMQQTFGVAVGDKAEAQRQLSILLKDQLPALRSESGITRVAGPEIKLMGGMTGLETDTPRVLLGTTAREQAVADMIEKRGAIASRARGDFYDPNDANSTTSWTDWRNQDIANQNDLAAKTEEFKTAVHANFPTTPEGGPGAPAPGGPRIVIQQAPPQTPAPAAPAAAPAAPAAPAEVTAPPATAAAPAEVTAPPAAAAPAAPAAVSPPAAPAAAATPPKMGWSIDSNGKPIFGPLPP